MQACKPVKEICLINYENDAVVRILEEKYGCTVRKASRADDCGGDTVYVLSDFESEDFLKFRASRPNAAVVGPMVEKHKLRVFENLTIYFFGFDDEETKDMTMNVIENGGSVVESPEGATHCVINSAADIPLGVRKLFSSAQRIVTNEWLWNSISIEYSANEEPYMIPDARTKLEVTSSPRAVTSFSITDTSRSDEGLSSEAATKKTKLQHLVDEMLFTDISYVNALKLLEEVKHDLEILADQPTELMDRQEIALIFGKVSPIVAVHEKIIKKIQECIAGGRHSDAVKKRLTLPGSRMFGEIQKKYAQGSPNKTCTEAAYANEIQKVDKRSKTVEEAILLIDKVISRANSVRAENDIGIEQLSFFNDVEGVPNQVPHGMDAETEEVNPYIYILKYVTHLLIPHIREINRVKLAEYDGVVIDRLEPQGKLDCFRDRFFINNKILLFR
ncbi:unnamed protein product [Heligmosomoides polygyrus]|uniref:BRCT domain-containing protein n=1 Tax=Heligmosomoides polygyrus TaxID=6339 RepID=A0A3P8AQP8_HELPZ|nr:unnamed protein product [Heligmosomoides polygyrus]